ncbi:putative spermidine/putrescine transport system substrate-binding protein [Pseudomonas panipatensis]|jgi:putative spermidine/putrescine transport system substrate-binding protein|uniref:Putative spermidine/putrescine transport system substrate-binding protein n=1 Tax=Pseudomonas panipatensis TaxID=428992 RepID=A0A1G8L002_9PSED|nr:putative spermidine/putrescine transport system substrate-binding protein [Pseudomonas panipatensis]SMP72905.1 putative spermidine/putrescine transport system substrate-binding protein [Pseudomonas panipatensis]
MRRFCFLLIFHAFFSLVGLPAFAAQENVLHVLAWPGYADDDVVKSFEEQYQAKVVVTFVDSDESLWDRMHAENGSLFDVVAANTAEIQRYVQERLLQPLDPAALPNTQKQLPRFRDLSSISGLVQEDKVYAIPFTYSAMGLIYDRRQVPVPPRSMSELWNPRYQGKVLAFNSAQHNFSFTALTLGFRDPFRLSADEMRATANKLVALRRNLLAYYSLPEEATDLFIRHRAALLFANYGTQQLTQLRQAGADIGYVIPDEGAIAWLDCWAMTRAAKNRDLAHAWINYMLEPAIGKLLSERQGLANTQVAPSELSDKTRLIWLQPVEDVARREALWSRIVSGERGEPF